MKLTENYVSEKDLNAIISYYAIKKHEVGDKIIKALLELKQRRAEDRQREFDEK